MAIRKSRIHKTSSYLHYKFPVLLRAFHTRNPAKITIMIIVFLGFLGGIVAVLYYTPSTALDDLIAFPLDLVMIFIAYSILVFSEILNDRRVDEDSTIDKEYTTCHGQAHGSLCSHKIGEHHYLELYNAAKVSFNCKDILNSFKKMHPIVSEVLRCTVSDKEGVYRSAVGSLDIPCATLEELRKEMRDGSIVIKLASTSYYNVFFTHYFPDYHLTAEQYDENSKERHSLRSLFHKYALEYIHSCIETFYLGTSVFSPYPLFPNPLGVTGICRYKDNNGEYYIRRLRTETSSVTNEQNTVDWTFSGIVQAHELFSGGREELTLKDYFEREMEDEFLKPLVSLEEARKTIIKNASSIPLGIVFSNKYLLQPELIVLVDLESFDNTHKEMLQKSSSFKLISYNNLANEPSDSEITFEVKTKTGKMKKQHFKKKEIYEPAKKLLIKYIINKSNRNTNLSNPPNGSQTP